MIWNEFDKVIRGFCCHHATIDEREVAPLYCVLRGCLEEAAHFLPAEDCRRLNILMRAEASAAANVYADDLKARMKAAGLRLRGFNIHPAFVRTEGPGSGQDGLLWIRYCAEVNQRNDSGRLRRIALAHLPLKDSRNGHIYRQAALWKLCPDLDDPLRGWEQPSVASLLLRARHQLGQFRTREIIAHYRDHVQEQKRRAHAIVADTFVDMIELSSTLMLPEERAQIRDWYTKGGGDPLIKEAFDKCA